MNYDIEALGVKFSGRTGTESFARAGEETHSGLGLDTC